MSIIKLRCGHERDVHPKLAEAIRLKRLALCVICDEYRDARVLDSRDVSL